MAYSIMNTSDIIAFIIFYLFLLYTYSSFNISYLYFSQSLINSLMIVHQLAPLQLYIPGPWKPEMLLHRTLDNWNLVRNALFSPWRISMSLVAAEFGLSMMLMSNYSSAKSIAIRHFVMLGWRYCIRSQCILYTRLISYGCERLVWTSNFYYIQAHNQLRIWYWRILCTQRHVWRMMVLLVL